MNCTTAHSTQLTMYHVGVNVLNCQKYNYFLEDAQEYWSIEYRPLYYCPNICCDI